MPQRPCLLDQPVGAQLRDCRIVSLRLIAVFRQSILWLRTMALLRKGVGKLLRFSGWEPIY
jgi:hypothetical protein